MKPVGYPLLTLAAVLLSGPAGRAADPAPAAKKVSYFQDVRPVFVQQCQGCHQPAKPMGGYVMTGHADLLKAGDHEQPGVVPGKPEASALVKQITPHGGKAEMPKGRDPLPDYQVRLITEWVRQGAVNDTPAAVKADRVNPDNPPVYNLPPVITALAYSPDGQLLAVSGYHEVLLHKADGSGMVGRLVGLSERVESLAFAPDGKTLAVSGGAPGRFGEVQLWDVARRKLTHSVPITFDTVYGVSWSPDGTKVAFGCTDNTIRAIDASTGQQVLFQGAHNDWVLGTAFSSEGHFLLSVSRDRSVKLTEVATQRFVDNVTSITPGALKGGLAAVALRPLKEHPPVKRDMTAGGGEQLYNEVLAAGADGTPRLYQIHRTKPRVIGDDANRLREFEPMPGRVYALAFSADGALFAAGSSLDGTGEVRVYSAADGKRVAKCEGQPGPVYAVAFRPDGQQVAAAGFDGTVRLFDPKTGKLIKQFSPLPPAKVAAR
jgi:mono/diheme cytochrome c family protein/DNA-binding beta-propeller fold protein YncE